MSLYRRAESQFWWCRFQVRGIEHKYSTGKTDRREAETEERRIRAEAESAAPVAKRRGFVSLTELAARDTERALAEGADPSSTERSVTSRWVPLIQHFGLDYDLQNLTTSAIHGYVLARRNWRTVRGTIRRIAGQTIRRELAALKRGCKMAKRDGAITQIPEEWPKMRKDPTHAAMRGKLRAPELLRELLSDANDRRTTGSKVDTAVRDHILFDLLTGVRGEGELRRVRLDWFRDPPAGVVGVAKLMYLPESGTKTRELRVVGVPQEAWDAVLRRAAVARDGVLFPHKSLGQWLRRYSKKRGIAPAISMRDLRHTYSTLGLQDTADAAAVQSAMGHADLRTTNMYQSATLARVAQVSVAVARQVVGTGKPAQVGFALSKPLEKQSARLAQLDRALVSEADASAILQRFLAITHSKNVEELTARIQRWSAQESAQVVEVDWVLLRCDGCNRDVDVYQPAPGGKCPACDYVLETA